MQIKTVLDKAKIYSGQPLEVASKALGFATLASVIYDSHINGKEKAIVNDRVNTVDRFERNFKQYMTMQKSSQSIADAKGVLFSVQRKANWHHVVSKITGYVIGVSKTILGNLPEIGLSILALRTKNHKFLGKASGVLLAVNAVKSILSDIFGVES